jgi:Phage major capsid protein E
MSPAICGRRTIRACARASSSSGGASAAPGRHPYDRYLDGAFLRQGQARGSFEYSGIGFEEYRGRVGTVDFTDASKAYFFPVGVPGLFRQYNAPADFVETANTIGLPRYAKQAADQQFARWVMLHVQSNSLPICTRPRVLIKGKRT